MFGLGLENLVNATDRLRGRVGGAAPDGQTRAVQSGPLCLGTHELIVRPLGSHA